MSWQQRNTGLGLINGDASVGGGAQNYSGDSEFLAIKARSQKWYIGVQNESTSSSSDFFIGLRDNEAQNNRLHIQQDGKIGIGNSSPSYEFDVTGTINCSGLIVNGTNFSGLSSSAVWTVSGSDISYVAGTVTVGDGSSNKRDFKVFANSTGNHVLLDASADTVTYTNVSQVITGGNLTVGADGTPQDVTFSSDVANSKFFWDGNGNISGEGLTDTANNEPCLSLGSNGGSEGADFVVFGHTNSKYMWWDCSADSLIVTGTIDVSGTANLDAVDIDGATQIDGTVTVGVNDTGYDVKFFSATAGSYMLWDESTDSLKVFNSAGNSEITPTNLNLGGSAGQVTSSSNYLDVLVNSQKTIQIVDNSETSLLRNNVFIGSSGTPVDFKAFGTDSGYMFYDASTPEFEMNRTLMDMNLADHAFDLDTTSGSIALSTESGGITIENTGSSGATTIQSAAQSGSAVYLNASGSHANTTLVINSAGTGVSAINIDSSGGVDMDAAGDINIDTTDTSDGIKLGAGVSGVPITLGHTTSEVTVADNLTVTGTFSGGRSVVQNVTTDDTLTAAESGKIFIFTDAAAVLTLPDSGDGSLIGVTYTFISNFQGTGQEVKCTDTTNEKMIGSVSVGDTDDVTSAGTFTAEAAQGYSSIEFTGTTEGEPGSMFKLTNIAADVWFIEGMVLSAGTSATPFATS